MNHSDHRKRRRHARKDFYGQIEGVVQGSSFYATIQNLSLGGMCFEVDYLFRIGLDLRLMFRVFDTDERPIEVKAEVVWIQPLHMLFNRVGVRFKQLGPEAKRIIKAHISGLKIESEKAVSGTGKYPLLFSPFELSGVTLNNRLTMAPMFWGYAEEDGSVSQMLLDRYREIALGGVGMIVVANAVVAESGTMAPRTLKIDEDRFIAGLAELAEVIKSSGAVACLQINHAGRWAKVKKRLSPSPVTMEVSSALSSLGWIGEEVAGRHQMRLANNLLSAVMRCRHGMTPEEIESVKQAYGQAALRAQKAGFDMVELHGATGYLLGQFLSPRTNKRSDGYGGSLENRMRFPLEVVETVKEFVGRDFPVGYRFLADEWLVGGFGIEEAKIFAQNLEKLAVAYLSVTAGTYESFFLPEVMNQCRKEGYIADLARKISEVVFTTAVIASGRVVRPALAEKMLRNNEADLIGLARSLFADPLWPRKALEGKEDKILSCRCCHNCLLSVIKDEPVTCRRWNEFKRKNVDIQLKQKKKKWEKILIVVDGSENSLDVVEYAGHMIGPGKKVVLFGVFTAVHGTEMAEKRMQNFLVQAKKQLQATGMDENDIETRMATNKKSVAKDILEQMKQGQFGSIILGKKIASRPHVPFSGGISNYIVEHAKDSGVWIVD